MFLHSVNQHRAFYQQHGEIECSIQTPPINVKGRVNGKIYPINLYLYGIASANHTEIGRVQAATISRNSPNIVVKIFKIIIIYTSTILP